MASNTEVAGISIGITADIGGLDASLSTATNKVNNWARRTSRRKIELVIDAKKGESWANIEKDLNTLVQRVTKGHSVPVNVDLHIEDPNAERERLEGVVKNQLKALKIPLEIDYKAKAHVDVTWSWADGEGPPTHIQGGGAPSGGTQGTTTRGRRRAATGDDQVTTPETTQAPQQPAQPARRGRTTPTTTSTVTAKPVAPQAQPQAAPETKGGGIADMPTATPQNVAKREKEAKIAANTAAHQAATEVSKVWRDVTRATAMAHSRRKIEGMAPITAAIPRGSSGFQSEYVGDQPTGNIRYTTPQGNVATQLRSRAPKTFGMEQRREGRTYMAYRGDPEDPRRGLSDPRSMRWFDPGGGFDPEVTRHSRQLFNEEMARREEEVFKKLEPVFAERARRPDEDEAAYRARIANTYTVSAWGKQVPMSAENILGTKTRIADVAKLPEIKELEKFRIGGDYGRFFGDPVEAVMSGEGTAGALALRAEAMQAIRLQSVLRATQAKGGELTEQERKAALSKGTQRARRLRNEGAGALPKTPEEALYLTLNAMIGNAFAEQEFAEQKLRQEQATAQGADTRLHNEAVAAFSEKFGHRPRYEPSAAEPERWGPDDWDAAFRDFEREYTPQGPRAKAERPRRTGADVPLTPKQQGIAAMRERFEELEVREQYGEASEEELTELEDLRERIADIKAGELAGSARQQPWERRMAARRVLARELEGYANRTGDLPAELLPPGWSAARGGEMGKGWAVTPPMEPEFEAEVLAAIQSQQRGLTGSARTRRSDLEAYAGTPAEVPDVRDIAEAMGIGRGGFGASGTRTKMTAGTRQKMQRVAKNADVEKVFALIGERYIDAAGRTLVDVREAIELETDPRKTSRYGFAVSQAGRQKLQKRLQDTGQALQGIVHSHLEGGLRLSEPGKAAVEGQDDESALRRLNEIIPGILSGVIAPSTKTGMRLYGVGEAGEIRPRAVSTGRNLRRGTIAPTAAQAATPTVEESLDALFSQLPPAEKDRMVAEWDPTMGSMPPAWRAWANQQATGTTQAAPEGEFREIAIQEGPRAGQVVGIQQGLFGPAVNASVGMGPAVAHIPPVAAAAAAAFGPRRGGGAPPPNFVQGNFGFVPPPPPAAPPGGAGRAPGGPSLSPTGRYSMGVRTAEQEALQAGVDPDLVEKIRDRAEAENDKVTAFLLEQQNIAANQLAATPVRALSTAMGQFVAQKLARGPAQARQRRVQSLDRAIKRASRIETENQQLAANREETLAVLQGGGIDPRTGKPATTERIEELTSEAQVFRQRQQRAERFLGKAQPRLAAAASAVAPVGIQIANLAALAPAIIAGGILFQAGMSIAQAGLDVLGKAASEGAEKLTGFHATVKRVQEGLAEQAFQTGGMRGAVAGVAGQAGMNLTPEQRMVLEGRTGAIVAAQRATQQIDLLRTIGTVGRGRARLGFDEALVNTTGGFLGTPIGGQAPLEEIIGNELERLKPPTGFQNFVAGAFQPQPLIDARMAEQTAAQQAYMDTLNQELRQVGSEVSAGPGQNVVFQSGPLGGAFASEEQKALGAQAAAFDDLEAGEFAAAVRSGAVAFRDENGKVITEVARLKEIIADLGDALETPDARESYIAREKQRNAAMMGIEFGFQNTNRTNSINNWRTMALNRPLPFGTGFNSGDAASRAAMDAFGGAFQDSLSTLNAAAAQGRQELQGLGVDPADINRLESLGDQIRGIQSDLAGRQLEVSTAAYNQQLMVAKRTLGDLAGLTGQIADSEATAVGMRERQNLALQRENTQLGREIQARSLDMAQRQLNLQVATAGFALAGETGAERAARREAAERDAALKQLDLDAQREIFGNEGQIVQNTILNVDETNLRAFQDAVFAVQQLEREHSLEKYAAGAEQMLDVLKREADITAAMVDNQIARGMNFVGLAQDEIRQTYIDSGQILTGVNEDIADSFKRIRMDFDEWLGDLGDYIPLQDPTGGGKRMEEGTGSGRFGGTFASGGLFNTAGATSMVVGEAGKETVAVLRNPRLYPSSGGGGVNLTLQFNGEINVREDEDIQRIARVVEQMIQQRAGLLGMMRDR